MVSYIILLCNRTINNYCNHRKSRRFNTIRCDESEILRAAVVVGGNLEPNQYPALIVKYKETLYNAFVGVDNRNYLTHINESYLEQSESTTVFYNLGMIFAQFIVYHQYNVRFLFHLSRSDLLNYDRNNQTVKNRKDQIVPMKNIPDLCGLLPNRSVAMLVEAKGTRGYRKKI